MYRVVYASSEDPEYPASDLLNSPGPASSASRQGWASCRNCDFPQSLILEMNSIISLRQIQFLSHQSKIATRIELFVSLDGDTWKRLGYLSLDSNDRSNFMARELKSVFVDTGNFRFLKVLLHRPHANKLNPHSQVSLVGIFLEISAPPPASTSAVAVAPSASGHAASSDVGGDLEISRKISDLQRRKAAAASAENFDEAKRIKAEIENLEISVRALKELEIRKQRAVDSEDFDTAKALKSEISRLKSSLGISGPPSRATAENFQPPPENSRRPDFSDRGYSAGQPATSVLPDPPENSEKKFPISLDEVPAVARGDAMREYMHFREISDQSGEDGSHHPLENCGVDDFRSLPRPAPLPTAALLEQEALLEIFGEYVVACAVSRDWKLREAGLGKMTREIENISVSHKVMISGFLPLLFKASEDKNPQAFVAATALGIALVPNFRLHLKRMGESEILVDRLLERVGDVNRKISDHAAALLIALGTDGAQAVGNFVLKSLRSKNLSRLAPKTLAAKIVVATKTIGNFEDDTALGISIGIECVKSQASVEGRQAGIALLKKCMEISSNFRSLLDPYLADLRPQQRDHVFQELFPSPPIRPASSGLISARISIDGRCQFCGERNDKFATDGSALDQHFLKECPALVECELCHQIVEKAALNDHIDSYECQPLAPNTNTNPI